MTNSVLDKAIKVINSCKNFNQLLVALEYCRLAKKRFNYFGWRYEKINEVIELKQDQLNKRRS